MGKGEAMMLDHFQSLRRRLVDWYRRQPLLLKAALVVVPLVMGKVVDKALDAASVEVGLSAWEVAAAIIAVVLLAAGVSLLFHKPEPDDPLPPIDFERIEVRRTFPVDELEKIRSGLHQDIYGGSAPIGDEITAMYRKNPRMGVGLFDPGRGDYVAFSTAWPLTQEAARRLIAGEMTENDLVADDVLSADENASARFVLVPAFGAAGIDGGAQRALLGNRLYYEMRKVLRQNFFTRRNRRITLIATGFSPKGRDWCRSQGMTETCLVTLPGDKEQVPVFTREIGWDDID